MKQNSLRRPAVAGQFYPAQPEVLARDLANYLKPPTNSTGNMDNAWGCVVPHAGYQYSGRVAGAVYGQLPVRSTYIILCPNHFGRGAPLAVMSEGAWLTPLGEAPVDQALAKSLREACAGMEDDAEAHVQEHSLEVQLPFLQRVAPEFQFVPVCVGVEDFAILESLGEEIARVIRAHSKQVMIIASSDMNHYEADSITRVKDGKAIERILALDPKGLYETVHRERITMCGYGPTVAMLTAMKQLGSTKAELVKYATSADSTGDRSSVVGYAGIILS